MLSVTPWLWTKFGERAFSFAGPASWNLLLTDLRSVSDSTVPFLENNSRAICLDWPLTFRRCFFILVFVIFSHETIVAPMFLVSLSNRHITNVIKMMMMVMMMMMKLESSMRLLPLPSSCDVSFHWWMNEWKIYIVRLKSILQKYA